MTIENARYSHRHGAAWDHVPLTEHPGSWSRAWPWLALIALLGVVGWWAFR